MPPQMQRGTVIVRRWDDETGLHEIAQPFETIEDLYTICLQTRYPMLVDRVIIEGEDDSGHAHTVNLVFQAVSVTGLEDSPPE